MTGSFTERNLVGHGGGALEGAMLGRAMAAAALLGLAGAAAAAPQGGEMIHWEAKADGSPKSYVLGPLTVTLTAGPLQGKEVPVPPPILEVRGPSGPAGRDVGELGFDNATADFGVFRLDNATPLPQVLFASYWGGAHCCYRIDVLDQVGGRWKILPLGAFDTDPPKTVRDVDGDGVSDIVLVDDAFDYAFSSFAGSWRPPVVINIRGGRVWDVSAQPRYRALYQADMRKAQSLCQGRRPDRNGACAGFVADAARLGRRAWAWKIMLANYDRAGMTGPDGCKVTAAGDCPESQKVVFTSFPAALDAFLRAYGYTRPSGVDALVEEKPAKSRR
jgi:hypothetical protein